MYARELYAAYEFLGLLEFPLTLPGKARYDVGGYGAARHGFAQHLHAPFIYGGIVAAVHAFEHSVAAALHGEMELTAYLRVAAQRRNKLFGKQLRFQRA